MRRDIKLMLALINGNKLCIEEETKRPLLKEDLPFSLSYRRANTHDIKFLVHSPVWTGLLLSGRAFFAEEIKDVVCC